MASALTVVETLLDGVRARSTPRLLIRALNWDDLELALHLARRASADLPTLRVALVTTSVIPHAPEGRHIATRLGIFAPSSEQDAIAWLSH